MRIKKFFPVVTVVGGIFLIYIFLQVVFSPIQSKISEMQTETKRLQLLEKNLTDLQNRHENFAEFVELNEERLAELQKLLPENSSQESFTPEIYKSAEKNKITVNLLQVGDLVPVDDDNKNFQKQSVKIKLTGNYISILNFIREISDGERFAKLESISMENSSENLIVCNAEFFIYSLNS